jgi:hypothetical protein
MKRATLWALAGCLLLCAGPAHTSPVKGSYREDTTGKARLRLMPGSSARFSCQFVANERACVIVEGDHDPVMKLVVKVFDPQGNLVTEDSGGDLLAVTWYPPRTQVYDVEIRKDPSDQTAFKMYNDLDVVVK